ncbi:uncharacterized protein LOC144543983 isoform X2 [Carex rostrata]
MDQAPLGIEKAREERINSNMERMKQLGILNLSRDVNSISQSLTPKKRGRDMLRKEKPIETSNITTKKRGRGRPRKEEIRLIETSKITPNITPRNWWHLRTRSIEVKMDRAPLGIEKAVEERQTQIETSNITPEKRGRGRPRKHHKEVNATSEKEEK